ncbi:NAD(P)H-dependent oxidoreductase subunit E [Pontiellaceae bacterium B12227]|nr:NAD(P)H-dependent oxidoreductase subunit E [Pontiellaceae bacterium B12227]
MLNEAESVNCSCDTEINLSAQYSKLDDILAEYKYKEGGLIPVLQIAQGLFGFLPEDVLHHISKAMDKPYSEVAGVVGFYSLFSTQPRGENVIRVCLGTACYVRGGKQVLDSIKKELKIDVGETTDDQMFSLEIARCFGACGLAPAIMINEDVHQRVKPSRIKQILAPYCKTEAEEVEHV